VGAVLAEQRDRAVRDVHQRGAEACRHIDALDGDWANVAAIEGGLVEFVRDLKRQTGGDVGVHGSISVARALLAAGVVDELRLTIGPMIAGRGRRLLDDLPPFQLEPIRSEVSPTGYLMLHHRVTSPTAAADAR
jgi:dihydrofolate reductase